MQTYYQRVWRLNTRSLVIGHQGFRFSRSWELDEWVLEERVWGCFSILAVLPPSTFSHYLGFTPATSRSPDTGYLKNKPLFHLNCPICSGKHHQVCGVLKPPDGEANHLVKEFGSLICEKIISLRFVKNTTVVYRHELKFDIFRNGLPFKYRTREPEYQRRNAMLCYDWACWLTEQNYRNYSSPKPSQHSSSGTVRTGKHESETNCKLTPEPEFQHCSSLSV